MNNVITKAYKGECKLFTECQEVLTVTDVAELLYVGKNTVYELLSSGDLQGFRIGRSWRIPRENLEEYIVRKCKESR